MNLTVIIIPSESAVVSDIQEMQFGSKTPTPISLLIEERDWLFECAGNRRMDVTTVSFPSNVPEPKLEGPRLDFGVGRFCSRGKPVSTTPQVSLRCFLCSLPKRIEW